MSETEVYQAVAKLFHDEEDLMLDFKTYLPDCGGGSGNNSYKHHKNQLENLANIEILEKTNQENAENSLKIPSIQAKKRPLETPPNNTNVMPKVNIIFFVKFTYITLA